MSEDKSELQINLNESLQYQFLFSFLGEMMGAIAHDLNNPLMILLGKADMIARGVKSKKWDNQKVIGAAEKIVDTSQKMSNIIESFRCLSVSRGRDEVRDLTMPQMLDDLDVFFKKKLSYVGAHFEKQVLGPQDKIYRVNYLKLGLSLIPWVNIIVENLKAANEDVEIGLVASAEGETLSLKLSAPFSLEDAEGYNNPDSFREEHKDWGLNLCVTELVAQSWGAKLKVDWTPSFQLVYSWSSQL